jgi:AraC-like DNA-binding protein
VLVVSYLPSQLLPQLTDVVNDLGADHVGAATLSGVEEVVRERPDGVMVVDPYADRTMRAREIARLLRHFPSTPMIAYTQFEPPAMRALALLSKRGLHETVLFRFDDSRSRFGRILVRASKRALVNKMLHGLEYEFSALEAPVVRAIKDMFERPHMYSSARDLVRISGTPLTSLYRAFYSVGLEPPKKMFIAARVLHAAALLRDPSITVQDIADKLSYRHPRVLTQHTLAVFRRRPTVLRREVTDEMLVTRLLEWVRRD